ncbi:hypothetical protein QJS04_geneDACA024787 [Acorus gramineus]|uniref:Uncharacterized protein n=1 Tax=Acorus gramineus TaxID=55184 RepID=A0AAV8ZYR3_ACOGR|nr:hypothetical protein QJS04_geneDACA024787 [Acorus gramineus]
MKSSTISTNASPLDEIHRPPRRSPPTPASPLHRSIRSTQSTARSTPRSRPTTSPLATFTTPSSHIHKGTEKLRYFL